MHILIAPNAFKNSLSAAEAAEAIRLGLEKSKLNHTSECFPIGDGGDGTAALIAWYKNGKVYRIEVQDPLGRKTEAAYAILNNGTTAVIEMAEASGLSKLTADERNPIIASSYGTGQLMLDALSRGVSEIVLAMGGSATVDGGTGILRALGIRFFDTQTNELTILPQQLPELAFIDISLLDERIKQCRITVLCDVDNPLLGEEGAATVFGPQKGASKEAVAQLETGLQQLAITALEQTHIDMQMLPYGGTAGGAAAGLHCFLQATLVKGIDYFLSNTGFENALQNCNLLITGEGSIDTQTLQGKGPAGVAKAARQKGIQVIALGGKVPLRVTDEMNSYFNQILAISDKCLPLDMALKNTRQDLIQTAMELGNRLAENHP